MNSILQLYPLKASLSSCLEKLQPLVKGLRQACQLELEPEHHHGYMHGRTWHEFGLGNEFEAALFTWSRHADQVMAEATMLNSKIETNSRLLEASMSCTRNRLLMFEVWINIATVATGAGAAVSGLFGMNLDSLGLDKSPGLFYG